MKKSAFEGFKQLSKNKMKKVKGGGDWFYINGEWVYVDY